LPPGLVENRRALDVALDQGEETIVLLGKSSEPLYDPNQLI
jgi:hypothetical protein